MAQFDVYRLPRTSALVVDCQSDLLRSLATRLAIPLVPASSADAVSPRLNPRLTIDGSDYLLMTQFATTIDRAALRTPLASLQEEDVVIIGAIDMLLSGV